MKPSTAKAKGRETENQAVEWLRYWWPNAERRRLQGVEDKGDIAGVPGMCIEVKSAAQWKPVQWLRETMVEKANADEEIGFCMARPKGGTDVNDWVILMTPGQLIDLLDEAGRLPAAE